MIIVGGAAIETGRPMVGSTGGIVRLDGVFVAAGVLVAGCDDAGVEWDAGIAGDDGGVLTTGVAGVSKLAGGAAIHRLFGSTSVVKPLWGQVTSSLPTAPIDKPVVMPSLPDKLSPGITTCLTNTPARVSAEAFTRACGTAGAVGAGVVGYRRLRIGRVDVVRVGVAPITTGRTLYILPIQIWRGYKEMRAVSTCGQCGEYALVCSDRQLLFRLAYQGPLLLWEFSECH